MVKYILITIFIAIGVSCSKSSDEIEKPQPPITESKPIQVFLTTRNGIHKLNKQLDLSFDTNTSSLTIVLDSTNLKQEIEGFGAALTGSSAYLIQKMTNDAKSKLLNTLFSTEGIKLNYIRLCIGSSDFSLGNYTYCDDNDLNKFSIPTIDKRDLLPVLKQIQKINPGIKIMSTPWSAPAWMKQNNHLYGGSLKGSEVYDDFSEYLAKYIKAFEAEGIRINAISIQNEPHHQSSTYPTMYMDWNEQNEIIQKYLGPRFEAYNISTDILIWDHNFDEYTYALNILNDQKTNKYIAGTAFHGYGGTPSAIDIMIQQFPSKKIYFTEQSGGGWNTDDPIGNMLYYMKDMLMPSINKGASNFLMWNLALDTNNGPVTNKIGGCQNCRGVVTIENDQKYSINEEYYLLGHFSKFINNGAHRIEHSIIGNKPQNFQISTFLNSDGSKVVVVLNQSANQQNFSIRIANRKFNYTLPDQAVVTFVYN